MFKNFTLFDWLDVIQMILLVIVYWYDKASLPSFTLIVGVGQLIAIRQRIEDKNI